MTNILRGLTVLLVTLSATSLPADPVTEDDIQKSFYPYNDWAPAFAGYEPGIVISQGNVEQFKAILDEGLYYLVKNAWVEIDTDKTTDFPLSDAYIEATRQFAANVSLNDNGTLNGFVAGRAYPQEPDANDPLAGQKLVWNYQYGFNAGDSETINPFWWTFRNAKTGKAERQLKFDWHFLNFSHRVTFEPKPAYTTNSGKIYRGIYGTVLEPFDLKNTQLMIHRYEDDTKRDDAWLYLGFQRRVRRLETGQTTDSFLGTDLMIEDFEGYNGRVTDYNWEYGGTRNLLLPFYYHNDMPLSSDPGNDPDGYRFVDVHGKGNCFPKVTYQLRKTYTLIGKPKDPNHPVGKRIINLDAQTATMAALTVYDRKGDLWKWFPIGKAHSDYHHPRNKGQGVALDDFATIIDVQTSHCTTLQFKSIITDDVNQPSLFAVQQLRKRGQ